MVTYTIALEWIRETKYDLANTTRVSESDCIFMKLNDSTYNEIRAVLGGFGCVWLKNNSNNEYYYMKDINHTAVYVKSPDGSIRLVNNSKDEIQLLDNTEGNENKRLYYVHIPSDPLLTDQIGTYIYQIECYNENSEYIGNVIFGAVITKKSNARIIEKNIDMWAGAAPTVLHLNQHDTDVKLTFTLFNSRGKFEDKSRLVKAKLIAREPRSKMSTEILGILGDGSYNTQNFTDSINAVFNDISKLTEHCGKVEAQIVLFHRGNGWSENKPFVSNGVEFSSSKIYIYVEPRP